MKFKYGDKVVFTKARIAGGVNHIGDTATYLGYDGRYNTYMVKPDRFNGQYGYLHKDFRVHGAYMLSSLGDIELLKKEELLDENT